MKTLVTILALSGILISAPALAQNSQRNQNPEATNEPLRDESVYFRGKRGQDPDWFIRFQILRDAQTTGK